MSPSPHPISIKVQVCERCHRLLHASDMGCPYCHSLELVTTHCLVAIEDLPAFCDLFEIPPVEIRRFAREMSRN